MAEILNEMNSKEIGERFVKLRGEKTQHEVSKAIGISVSALSMYERGEHIPKETDSLLQA